MIDTHTHLTSERYKDDLDKVIQNAKDNHIDYIVSQGTSLVNAKDVLELSKKHKGYIYPTIGIHPEDIAEIFLEDPNKRTKEYVDKYINSLKELTEVNKDEFKAIGEIGLDYFMFKVNEKVTKLTDKEKTELIDYQQYFLEKLLELSLIVNLPVVIHSREYPEVNEVFGINKCLSDILNIFNKIEKGSGKTIKGVLHCWTYPDKDLLKQLLDKGYFVSFTNIICYPKNTVLLELANFVNKEYPNQIMLETDSPYLPPAHKRGQRSEPSDVQFVYEKFPMSYERIDNNSKEFFNLV